MRTKLVLIMLATLLLVGCGASRRYPSGMYADTRVVITNLIDTSCQLAANSKPIRILEPGETYHLGYNFWLGRIGDSVVVTCTYWRPNGSVAGVASRNFQRFYSGYRYNWEIRNVGGLRPLEGSLYD